MIIVLTHWRLTRGPGSMPSAVATALAALVRHWGRRSSRVLLESRSTTVGAQTTAEDAEEESTTNTGSDTNDECEMTLDPGSDFFSNGATLANTLRSVSYEKKRDVNSDMTYVLA